MYNDKYIPSNCYECVIVYNLSRKIVGQCEIYIYVRHIHRKNLWRSQLEFCPAIIITILFFRNRLFSQSMNTDISTNT